MLNRLKVQHCDNGGRAFPNLTVAEAWALFFQHCEVDKRLGTFTHYKTKLKPFVERFGKRALLQMHLTDSVSFKKKLIDRGLENGTVNHPDPRRQDGAKLGC